MNLGFLSDDELKELASQLKILFEWKGLYPHLVLEQHIKKSLLELVLDVDRKKIGAQERFMQIDVWLEEKAAEHCMHPTAFGASEAKPLE